MLDSEVLSKFNAIGIHFSQSDIDLYNEQLFTFVNQVEYKQENISPEMYVAQYINDVPEDYIEDITSLPSELQYQYLVFFNAEVPGITFLSGGQTEIEATQNLNEINKINNTNFTMSFSYGRALQQGALKNWGKNIKDTINTQKIFNHRSKMNGLSTYAKWTMDLEKQVTA